MGEASYRLYNCGRCAALVLICRDCDRGQRYCSAQCGVRSRREQTRRAQARYQRTRPGAMRHADRQQTYRDRLAQKVTHQGSKPAVVARNVSATTLRQAPTHATAAIHHRLCHFCGAVLRALARVRDHWDWPLH